MNVIVTKNKVDYSGFVKVSTVKDANVLVGDIEYFVYNRSDDVDEDRVNYLTKIKDRAKHMIYICRKEELENDVYIVVTGSGGKYFDDEFFLESSSELNALMGSINEVTALTELGGVNVLKDFFNRYLKDGGSGFNPNYLTVVKQAVLDMVEGYRQKDFELLRLAETATEIFSSSVNIISGMESEYAKMQSVVDELENSRDTLPAPKGPGSFGMPSVVFFPQVSYLKEKNIIRIKDVGGCIYLTTFMLCFRSFLEKMKNVRPKLIFVESVGMMYEKKYKEYPWVTQQTSKSMSNYYNNIVFTNCPSKEVVTRLLEDTDYDTFVVVDRIKNSKQHILNSKGSSIRYAVSGSSVVDSFGLRVQDCFSSIKAVDGFLFTIPVFPSYPKESDQRERLYMRSFSSEYEMLYNVRRR